MVTKLIVDFNAGSEPWRNIDDVVMGGVSSSRMRIEETVAIFEGELSLEKNGGFASVRSEVPEWNLEGFDGVRLRVKGDGKKYQFRVRANTALDGPSHQITFETKKNTWTEVELPFSKFIAAFRGRELPNHPPIIPADISTIGFLIADRQEGNFHLEIDWLRAYRFVEDSELNK